MLNEIQVVCCFKLKCDIPNVWLKFLYSDIYYNYRVDLGCYISGIRAGRSIRPMLSNVVYSSVRDKCVKHCRYLLLFWSFVCRSWFEAKWGRSGASQVYSVVGCWCAAVGDSASVVEALLFAEFEGNMDLRFWLFNKLECLGKRIIVIRWSLESCYVQRYWWTVKLLFK